MNCHRHRFWRLWRYGIFLMWTLMALKLWQCIVCFLPIFCKLIVRIWFVPEHLKVLVVKNANNNHLQTTYIVFPLPLCTSGTASVLLRGSTENTAFLPWFLSSFWSGVPLNSFACQGPGMPVHKIEWDKTVEWVNISTPLYWAVPWQRPAPASGSPTWVWHPSGGCGGSNRTGRCRVWSASCLDGCPLRRGRRRRLPQTWQPQGR